jgi:acetyl-CoA carboxylase biotin carboxyl carrier protein
MTIDEIKELIRVVHETGIAELEYQRGENRVRIRSAVAIASEISHVTGATPAVVPVAAATHAPVPAGFASDAKVHQLPVPAADERNEIIKSPIVGTYYDSPSPGSGPFVKVGDRVEPKQVLCIIESMKLMNEIESELAGIVVAKHIENGRPVEYGESLFTIRPQ